MPPQVSILTVYYNAPADVLALQQSMRQYLPAGSYEWIVADNHSKEPLADRLGDAIYLRFENNFGFGKANNLASEKATAPYLFFVNPDCLFVENCLPPLLNALHDAGVAGPRVINEDGSIQLSFGPFLSIYNESLQKRRMKAEGSPEFQQWMRENAQSAAQYVSGCALMISAKLYREIGGFDERFFLYEEDVDLCKRVTEAGFQIRYVPSAAILHKRNRSVREDRLRANQEYRKSQVTYYRKHHGWFQNFLLKLYLKFAR